MRVALLSFNAQVHNAVGDHVIEKVRFFQERGAQVRVYLQDVRRLHPGLRDCTIEVREPRMDGPVWEELRQADLIFAIYGQHHDLLQYLPLLAGMGPRIVFDYLGVTPPELWPDQQREGLDVSIRQRGYAWCADHVLTTSATTRRELLVATGFPREHVATLPPAVDTARFRSEPRERHLHARLGIVGPILLFVGRCAGNKRVPLLIEALAPSARCPCGAYRRLQRCLCGGSGAVPGACRSTRRGGARALAGQVEDTELARAYRSADVLVIPSLHEGFCVPVIEAMASGLPVLASRSAALPETVGNGGLTFTPDDVNDLVRQLDRVLGDGRRTSFSSPAPRPGVPGRGEERPRRIAIVSFRFGPEIVGGAGDIIADDGGKAAGRGASRRDLCDLHDGGSALDE